MSSNRRIQSSRANGAKSRGPVTPEGKRKSASHTNSGVLRHGLLSSLVVLDDEKPEIFAEIFNALTNEFAPQTEAERILVENMAVSRWRQMRLWVIERASFQSEIEKHDAGAIHPATRAALAFRALADQSRALDLLNRYESRFDRQFARSLNLLMKLADPENPLHRLRQTNLVPNSDTPVGSPGRTERSRRKSPCHASRPSRRTPGAGREFLHTREFRAPASPMRAPATKAPLATSAESPAQSATTPSWPREVTARRFAKPTRPPVKRTQPFSSLEIRLPAEL